MPVVWRGLHAGAPPGGADGVGGRSLRRLVALPAMTEERIRLGHGGGGTLMQELIDQEFRRLYSDPGLLLHDAATLERPAGALAGFLLHAIPHGLLERHARVAEVVRAAEPR